jgi:subtilisin family serine protease
VNTLTGLSVLMLSLLVSSGPVTQQANPLYLENSPQAMTVSDLVPATNAAKAQLVQRYPQAVVRLQGKLLELLDQRVRLGADQALLFARAADLPVSGNAVTVVAVPVEGISPADLGAALTARGATIVWTGKQAVKANIPLDLLQTLATDVKELDYSRLPTKPLAVNTVISEGVTLTHADEWHARTLGGAGVKLAVIDLGFIGLATLQAADEIPASAVTVDYTGTGMESTTNHGCGVAEIIYDMAPNVQLYLIKVGDETQLETAGSYCAANGIKVVNHSVGWYGFNFFDGVAYSSVVPSPETVVNDANANGIVWANAAGNDQTAHCLISWQDVNGNGALDWAPGPVEINQIGYQNAGASVVLQLTWSAWPTTNQDFDMYLVRWNGSSWVAVASSAARQTGTQPPTESIGYTVSTAGYYGVVVTRYSANTAPTFILRSFYQNVQYYSYGNSTTPAPGSIGCPADSASTLAAGAINKANYLTGPIESFSSIGPTNGAYTGQPVLTKPDVCGPDGTASVTYSSGFYGTSAASPHVAGTAALAWSAFPAYTNAEIKNYLESGGMNPDLGTPGKDNTYGYGPVVLEDSFHSLRLTISNSQWGAVTVDPNQPDPNDPNLLSYVPGQVVLLEANAISGRYFAGWTIFDPNYPGDLNYADVNDANTVLNLTMNADWQVEASFKCGTGTAAVAPLLAIAIVICGCAVRCGRSGK